MKHLHQWFGHLPIGLVAEHGYYYSLPPRHQRQAPLSPREALRRAAMASAAASSSATTAPSATTSSTSTATSTAAAAATAADSSQASTQSGSNRVGFSQLALDADVKSSRQWMQTVPGLELSWRDEVLVLLEYFADRTPGAVIDVKDSCFSWHFGDTDPSFGLNQVCAAARDARWTATVVFVSTTVGSPL